MNSKKVAIVIVHFGEIAQTLRSIKSVQKYFPKYASLIVVNNDPTISIDVYLKEYKNVVCIKNTQNLGFAKAVNKGIKNALNENLDYIVLLNNDAYLDSDAFSPLIDLLETQSHYGIAAPVIEFKKKRTLFDYGGSVNKVFGSTHHTNHDEYTKTEPIITDYVSGCCMMIKGEVFKKVGYFDEQYFMYYEDVDFCLRGKEKGYLTVVIPKAKIHHELSSSADRDRPRAVYNQMKSARLFGKKYFGNRLFLLYQMIKYIRHDIHYIVPIVKSFR
jgi:GT2 family glycosyltransferase